MAIYEKSVKLLFRDMIKELDIKKGDVIKRVGAQLGTSIGLLVYKQFHV